LKKAAALTNKELGTLPTEKADLIVKAADEVIEGIELAKKYHVKTVTVRPCDVRLAAKMCADLSRYLALARKVRGNPRPPPFKKSHHF